MERVVNEPDIPSGMVEVTMEQFFALMRAQKHDVMPSQSAPTHTVWKAPLQPVWGWSTPGWKHVGEWPKRYAVRADAIKEVAES